MLKSIGQVDSPDHAIESDVINVVCAADDNYAMPLAVTLVSALEKLDEDSSVRLYLLDGGISDANWRRLEESLAAFPIEIESIQPDQTLFSDLRISHHISHTAYFRLLAAELLPTDLARVIYLDSDLYFQDDLLQLWQIPLQDEYCAATVDIACPFVDARLGSPNFRMASPYLAAYRPIPNYRQLGIDGRLEYFNSGVMLMNLNRWRKEKVADQLLRVLRENERYVWCWDQYALNVVFCGQWKKFAPRWNQGAHTFEYPSANHAPIPAQQWQEMKEHPAIVHFTTEFKPWHFRSDHPRAHLFHQGLRNTAWHQWQPEKPAFSWQKWCQKHTTRFVKQATISSRKIASIWN